MLELKNVRKVYQTKEEKIVALDSVSLSFNDSGLVFILGQSGSGKTTMLNIIGGIDTATEGDVSFNGKSLSAYSLESYRRDIVSFIFQEYNLLPKLNVYENMALVTSVESKEEKDILIKNTLSNIGLQGYEQRKVQELSGGQKQRIAIGRALVKNSRVLLCDEPTGNLDSRTSKDIIEILRNISKDKLVIVVSHNEELAKEYADRIIYIKDGKIEKDEMIGDISDSQYGEVRMNHMSFKSILKYGFNNLSSHRFKTIVSMLLILLSFIAIGCMVICLTYSSEYINHKISKNDEYEYVVMNSGSKDFPRTMDFSYQLGNIDSIIDPTLRSDGYNIQNSVYYIVNGDEDILKSMNFYFREPLRDNSCYITDYYLYFVLQQDERYKVEDFLKLEDLKDTNVYYESVFQYSIAGIIETDYLDYFTETGLEKSSNASNVIKRETSHKKYYEYNVLFGNQNTFDSLLSGKSSLSYRIEDSDTIVCNINNEMEYIPSLNIQFNEYNSVYKFFTNDGYFSSLTEESEYTKKVELNSDEVVISQKLYNYLFDEKIDWNDLYSNYIYGLADSKPYENGIPHIMEEMSLTIITKTSTIEIGNVKIVGVEVDNVEDFIIYGNSNLGKIKNTAICEKIVSMIDWQKIYNKQRTLVLLRNENMLLSGARFSIAYDYEPFIGYMSYFFIGVAIMFGLITIISILNLVIHRISDNKKEIGILYATGCKKIEITLMYMFPIVFIALLSLVISIAIVLGVCLIVNVKLIQDEIGYLSLFSLNYQAVLVLLSFIILLVLISVIPLHNYLKKNPMDIIRKTY